MAGHAALREFGSHSCTDPDTLVALPDDQLMLELERSRAVLERIGSKPRKQTLARDVTMGCDCIVSGSSPC